MKSDKFHKSTNCLNAVTTVKGGSYNIFACRSDFSLTATGVTPSDPTILHFCCTHTPRGVQEKKIVAWQSQFFFSLTRKGPMVRIFVGL